MNALVYNVALLLGVILAGVGVGLAHGLASALTVVGLLLILLTMFGASLARRG